MLGHCLRSCSNAYKLFLSMIALICWDVGGFGGLLVDFSYFFEPMLLNSIISILANQNITLMYKDKNKYKNQSEIRYSLATVA